MTETLPKEQKVTLQLIGRSQDLPEGRKVFLGVEQSGAHDGVFMRFVNREGEETKLRLSYDAMDALLQLYALHLRDRTKSETHWVKVEEVKKGDASE